MTKVVPSLLCCLRTTEKTDLFSRTRRAQERQTHIKDFVLELKEDRSDQQLLFTPEQLQQRLEASDAASG